MTTNIRAVAYDVDGVIIPNGYGSARLYDPDFLNSLGVDVDTFKEVVNTAYNEGGLHIGISDSKDAIMAALTAQGKAEHFDAVMRNWLSISEGVEQEVLETARVLRSNGVATFLATNQCRTRGEHLWHEIGLSEHYDANLASYELGAEKPEYDFYRRAFEKIKLQIPDITPEEVLFLDDREENVAAAIACGWSARLVEKPAMVKTILADYNLINNVLEAGC